MEPITIRLDNETEKDVNALARKMKLNKSKLLRELITLGLDSYQAREELGISGIYGRNRLSPAEQIAVSSSIETLLILREKLEKEGDSDVLEKAHEKTKEILEDRW